ncbi:MAG TPA: chloride channel protein [Bacteroidales bacterium]|nr:chloride channel protein [Bacteroidales bacterium]HPT09146.1 chloride channel protein [Bacteroidales bacterium]
MIPKSLIGRLYVWRLRHLRQRDFVLILSVLVGIGSGLAAVALKNTLYYTNYFLTNGFSYHGLYYLYLAFPVVGIILTLLFLKFVVRDNISHGVSKVLYAISKNNSNIRPHNAFSSLVACTLTLGFGGSVGPEAPVVLSGSAIGSNLARIFRLDYKTRTMLIGCGAAGAIAGIFEAPIAGAVFVLEILMMDLTIATIIPLLITTVTASLLSFFLMGNEVLFSFTLNNPFLLKHIPFYLLLGIFTGLVSVFFIRGSISIETLMKKIPVVPRVTLAGLVLAVSIFIYPSLFGEGYTVLKSVINGQGEVIGSYSFFGTLKENHWSFLLIVFSLIVMKVVAMAVTQGSGGIGGTFAPSIFVGAICGFFFASFLNQLFGFSISLSNFSLVGMAGVMAGVMHAPLTAIFLIAEITGGYQLLTPLIIVSAIAYLTSHVFESHSIYARQLAIRKELITHDKDKAVLSFMNPRQLIETNFSMIDPEATLGELVKVVATSTRNIFPVVDRSGNFYGIVTLDIIRQIMFDQSLYEITYVKGLMVWPDRTLDPDDPMDVIVQLFDRSDLYNLPVLKEGKYLGFISRARIFSQYREMLRKFSED